MTRRLAGRSLPLPTAQDESAPTYRYWGRIDPTSRASSMLSSIKTSASGDAATLRIYGPIDPWGGYWGVSAKDVAAALDGLDEGVKTIQLRINSPGGSVFEGLGILNMLRAHPAKVTAVVDGLAASIASVIAAGADETIMSPGSQMMIHNGSAGTWGDKTELAKVLRMLTSIDASIASIYAEATGSPATEFAILMEAETWYTAEEAVTAGLADEIAVVPEASVAITAGADDEQVVVVVPDPDDPEDGFDLSIYRYAGRQAAPAPAALGGHKPPTASAGGSLNTTGGTAVAFTPEQLTAMRAKLQLPADADEAAILNAVTAVVDESLEQADPQATTTAPAPVAQAAPTATAQQAAAPTAPVAPQPTAAGTMVIDSAAWQEREDRIKRLEATDAQRRREERDAVIAQANRDGKFPPARNEHWTRLWDADPEGTRAVINSLAKNVVPVESLGSDTAEAGIDEEYAHLFPPSQKG